MGQQCPYKSTTLGKLVIPVRKMETEKQKNIKLDLHLTHPDVTEHLYVKSKTLKYFYNLRDRQKSLSDDMKSRAQIKKWIHPSSSENHSYYSNTTKALKG